MEIRLYGFYDTLDALVTFSRILFFVADVVQHSHSTSALRIVFPIVTSTETYGFWFREHYKENCVLIKLSSAVVLFNEPLKSLIIGWWKIRFFRTFLET